MMLRGISLFSSFWGSSQPLPTSPPEVEPIDIDIEEDWIKLDAAPLPTAYSKYLHEITYDPLKPLGNSSHDVFLGKHKHDHSTHFVKHHSNQAMVYCESFLSHLYSLSLLYGVARSYARHNETEIPVAVSSKGLSGFETFKEAPLVIEQFNDPAFKRRFIRTLAVFRRINEDDAHAKNWTTNLKIFDTDCGLWDVTHYMKSGRPNVDGLVRDPNTAFRVSKKEIRRSPNHVSSNPWYSPCRENNVSSLVSHNPWSPAEVKLVQSLEFDPETLPIYFEEYLDWILDISVRFPHIAALNIPSNLTAPHHPDYRLVIDLYCEKNKEIDAIYQKKLANMPEFQQFIAKNRNGILFNILVRMLIRNSRLEKEKAQSHLCFEKQFNQALLKPQDIIERFNTLIQKTTERTIFAASSLGFSMLAPPNYEFKMKDTIPVIEKALVRANELIKLEAMHGDEDWELLNLDPSRAKENTGLVYR